MLAPMITMSIVMFVVGFIASGKFEDRILNGAMLALMWPIVIVLGAFFAMMWLLIGLLLILTLPIVLIKNELSKDR